MGWIFILAGIGVSLVSLVCWIIILIDAFRNEVWKGLACIFCFIYGLYYMFVEFEHDEKLKIIVGSIAASIVGTLLTNVGQTMLGVAVVGLP